MSQYRHPDPDCSCGTCNGPSQEVQDLITQNISDYIDKLMIEKELE